MEKEFPIIETRRLILREVTTEDANDMLKYLSDKDVVKSMGLIPFQSYLYGVTHTKKQEKV